MLSAEQSIQELEKKLSATSSDSNGNRKNRVIDVTAR